MPDPRPGAEPPVADAQPLLRASDVWLVFGGVVACRSVSFEVPRGGLISLIGPNGAGKTSFFNVLTGFYKPARGRVELDGRNVTGARPDRILHAGIARTYQNIRLFSTMTALENVLVGAHARLRTGLVRAIVPSRLARREEAAVRERARELLDYVGLPAASVDRLATTLSYGDQRRVEIARALASDPKLLLLDEPTAGMNPAESAQLARFLQRLRDELGLSILLIEHDMKVVMSVSDRVTVLDRGQTIAEGHPAGVRENPAVRDAYLGTGAA